MNADGTRVRLIGIISWGKGCGRENYYGVYARVAAFQDWIDATVENMAKQAEEYTTTTTAAPVTTPEPEGGFFDGLEYEACQSFLMSKRKLMIEPWTLTMVRTGLTTLSSLRMI